MSQALTTGGTTVKTRYVLGLEEQTGDPAHNPITKYESVHGVCNVVIVGSGPSETISYIATDGLGSVSEALDGNGNVTAQQLYGPYGGVRYSSGSMPTAKGYTGQYADATTGLDYYGARYYDPLVGQFISPDSVAAGGLNRYAYVGGNPETRTDPTGHVYCPGTCSGGGGSGGNSGNSGNSGNGTCTSNCGGGCTSDASCGCYVSCGGTPPGNPCGGCSGQSNSSISNCYLTLNCGGVSPSSDVTLLGIVALIERERVARIIARLNMKTVRVSGYTNQYGTDVAPYMRRPAGNLARIKFFEEYGEWVEAAGWVLTALGFVLDAKSTADSYYQARPDQGRGQAVAMGIVHASYVTGGALIGGFLGSFIPIPFVGTALGAAGGAWVGGWIGDQFVTAQATPNNGYSGPDNQDVPGPASGL